MRLALAQIAPHPLDVAANLRASERRIADAASQGAALVAFPELSLTSYELAGIAATPACWLRAGDARLEGVRRACQEHRVTAVLGAPWQVEGEARPRIAAVLVHADGSVGFSSKEYVHGSERHVFLAGPPAPAFEVAGWRVAVAICFDMAHPAHAMAAAAQRIDLYLGSALYTREEERRCDLHFGARAMDHRVFAALANYAGTSGGLASCGGSGVWRPTGEVLQRAGGGEVEALLVLELDRRELDAFR
jgi:predicted amidohydrolase